MSSSPLSINPASAVCTTGDGTQSVAATTAPTARTIHDGTTAPPPYAIASLFLLQSHNENFGLAIADALAHGVPAVVTDTTPWQALGDGPRGWCVPWESYADAVREATRMTAGELAARGRAARAWVLAEFSWDRSAQRLAEFYATL